VTNVSKEVMYIHTCMHACIQMFTAPGFVYRGWLRLNEIVLQGGGGRGGELLLSEFTRATPANRMQL